MDPRHHLDNRFGFTRYRVPANATDGFLALQQKAAAVYREHALGWRLARNRTNSEDWLEFGPRFRERRALERAAEALEEDRVLERLADFEVTVPPTRARVNPPPGGKGTVEVDPASRVEDEEDGPITAIVRQVSTDEYDTVLEVGDHPVAFFARDLPPIDPAEMSEPMRLAQRLAAALAPRLNAVVPEPFRVVAEQEAVYLLDDGPFRMGGSIVDRDIEGAVWGWLEQLQDEVTERLAVPWPHDPAQGYVFHEPGVAIKD